MGDGENTLSLREVAHFAQDAVSLLSECFRKCTTYIFLFNLLFITPRQDQGLLI